MQLKWIQLATVSVHIIYYHKSTTKSKLQLLLSPKKGPRDKTQIQSFIYKIKLCYVSSFS